MIVRLGSGVALVFTLAAVIAASGACSSDADATNNASSSGGSTTSSAGGSPTISKSECTSRCSAKLTACQAPSEQVGPGCDQLCGGGVTESQATCLEGTACTKLGSLAEGGSLDTLCPKSTGSSSGSSTSGSTSSGSTSSSGSTDDTPTSLTITATIPSSGAVIHTTTDGKVASLFNVAPQPTFDPNVQISSGHLPQLDKAGSVTLDSPDRASGACGTSKFSFVLNSSQIGVQIAGSDDLPATDCAEFTDDLAKGATFTLKDVPWSNSTVKATVKIVLK